MVGAPGDGSVATWKVDMTKRRQQNAAAIYLSKWSRTSDTYKTMRAALARVVKVLDEAEEVESYPWHELRYASARGISAALADEDFSPSTINQALVAVRGVLETAWRAGLLPDEEYRRIEVVNVSGNGLPAGRALSHEELDAVVAALLKVEPRDAALMAVLAATGIRRIEAVGLVREDYNPETKRLNATGKRKKKRSIPVGKRWRPTIEAWFAALAPGQLAFDLGGKNPRRQVSYVVDSFWRKCGLAPFSPHDLRRSFGTRICEVADIAVAQRLLGHTNVQTTTLYDRRGEKVEDAAVEDL